MGIAAGIESQWTGPHVDQERMEEYWHCPSTGISVWDDPKNWASFIERVAEQLLQTGAFCPEREQADSAEQQKPQPSESTGRKKGSVDQSDVVSMFAAGAILDKNISSNVPKPADAWAALDDLLEMGTSAPSAQAGDKAAGWEAIEKDIASQKKGVWTQHRGALPELPIAALGPRTTLDAGRKPA